MFSLRHDAATRALVLTLIAVGPGCIDDHGLDDDALDDQPPDGCAFDDVTFDPHDGTVVQGIGDVACVRLERAPRADVRRGTEWRASSLAVVVDGRARDVAGDALAYENSHHNCRDVVTSADDDLELVIDGVGDDASVCFDGAPEAWRLVLSVNGAAHVLRPLTFPR